MDSKLQPVDLQICIGIIRLGEIEYDNLSVERLGALITLSSLCQGYQKEFSDNPLVRHICEKKIEFILQSKSKSDLKEILSPPKVYYNGNEVVPDGKFHVEEEELLIWSLTSHIRIKLPPPAVIAWSYFLHWLKWISSQMKNKMERNPDCTMKHLSNKHLLAPVNGHFLCKNEKWPEKYLPIFQKCLQGFTIKTRVV